MVAMEIAASANLLLQAEGHGMIRCVHGDENRVGNHGLRPYMKSTVYLNGCEISNRPTLHLK